MAKRNAVFPEGREHLYDNFGYSAAVRSGNFLFVSGQVGSDGDGSPIDDPQTQFTQAFENLKSVLAAANCTLDDIVDVTSFHIDPDKYMAPFMAAKQAVFGTKPYPCWTALGVTWLDSFLFEVKVIARIPDGETV